MGWATHYIEKLRAGETVSFRPRGASIKGRIESGHLCKVVPVDCSTLSVGDNSIYPSSLILVSVKSVRTLYTPNSCATPNKQNCNADFGESREVRGHDQATTCASESDFFKVPRLW
jgi:hypothetical protein